MPFTPTVVLMLVLDLLAVGFLLAVLARRGARRAVTVGSAAAAAAWLAALLALQLRGLAPSPHISGPAFLGLVLAFVGLIGVPLTLPAVRAHLSTWEPADRLLPQGVRVFFGASFLAMTAQGELPLTFGLIDGFTHVTAGFLGLLASTGAGGRRLALGAHLFGLADILVVATTLSLVLLPELTPHHPMMLAVFLPAPLWLWLHVIALVPALRTARSGATTA